MKMRCAVVSSVLVGSLLLLSACGRQSTPTGVPGVTGTPGNMKVVSPDGTVATINTSPDGNVVIKTNKSKDGESTFSAGAQVEIPKDFPKDAPVYPGAKPFQTLVVPNGHHVLFNTNDPVKKVWDFYADKLTKDGWMQQAQLQTGEGGTITGKKENRTCAAIISKGDDAVTISLTVVVE